MNKILILLAPGFEEIEAVTVIDLLRRAELSVIIAGLEKKRVLGSHGISIEVDNYYLDLNPDDFDYLVLPGGQPGTNNLKADSTVVDWVKKFNKSGKRIAAICAAPTVLLAAGILDGKKITSFPAEQDKFSKSNYLETSVVVDENITTSRGVGTSIEFALEIIKQIRGERIRDKIAERIIWK